VAKLIERLSPLQASKLKEPGYYCDGAGLYLQIAKGGSKSWVFRYTVNGKAREMGLGSCATFTLAEARKRATERRKALSKPTNPAGVATSTATSGETL
jgi:hypothetical protein